MIVNDDAGTTQRPHLMLLLIAFPDARRLVLSGDHFQLPALGKIKPFGDAICVRR